jgi:hypothetical protein
VLKVVLDSAPLFGISHLVNAFNAKLQDKRKVISFIFRDIKGLEMKLKPLENTDVCNLSSHHLLQMDG